MRVPIHCTKRLLCAANWYHDAASDSMAKWNVGQSAGTAQPSRSLSQACRMPRGSDSGAFLERSLLDTYDAMVRGIQSALRFATKAALAAGIAALWGAVFLSTFGVLLLAAFVGLTIVMKVSENLGIGRALGIIINVVVAVFVVIQLLDTAFAVAGINAFIPGGFSHYVDWSYTLADFIIASSLAVAGAMRVWKTFDDAVANLFGSALALIFLAVSAAASKGRTIASLLVGTLADGAAMAIAWLGDTYRITPNVGIFKTHSILAPLAKALDFYARATTVSTFVKDVVDLYRLASSGSPG